MGVLSEERAQGDEVGRNKDRWNRGWPALRRDQSVSPPRS